jgi:hypothetical protein
MNSEDKTLYHVVTGLAEMVDFVIKGGKVFVRGAMRNVVGRELRKHYRDGPIKELVRKIESYDMDKEELTVIERVVLRQPAKFVTLHFRQTREKKKE